jgi:hypothetical protein
VVNTEYRVPAALSSRQTSFVQDGRTVWFKLGYAF